MKKLIVLAVASLFATSAVAGEMKWSGSAGWRYNQTKLEDSLNSKNAAGKDISKTTTKSHAMRANLGVSGGWENVEWGVGLRTLGAANTDYVTANNAADRTIALEQGWFRYVRDFGSLDMSATIGRQMNVFAYDGWSQQLFDSDVRFDGLGWQFKFGMFGMNAAQYILGAKSQGTNGASTHTSSDATDSVATTQSKFNTLIGFQPHMTWKFTDEIETMFAVGYYLWNDDSNQNGSTGGVTTGNANLTGANTNVNVHNLRQWQFMNTWTLPYKLSAQIEYVMNKEVKYSSGTVTGYTGNNVDMDKNAFSAGLKYGDVKKAHDWSVGYIYGSKGLASVIDTYSNNLFLPDNKGHTFHAGYALADNFHIGFKWMSLKEKGKKNAATGLALTGANAKQEMKTKYMEITTGVMF